MKPKNPRHLKKCRGGDRDTVSLSEVHNTDGGAVAEGAGICRPVYVAISAGVYLHRAVSQLPLGLNCLRFLIHSE
jgi:hypothetical protein